jgi:cytoskeletal protein CcmA (bactofilin family)
MHRYTSLAALTLLFLILVPAGMAATTTAQGSSAAIVVDANETVESINGYAGAIVVRGTVTGNVSGAAGSIHITESGSVGGSIGAAAGTVRIDGSVTGDVEVAAGTVEVTETARINGSLQAGGGYVSVDGSVGGEARLSADTLDIGPNADIGGDLRYAAESFDRHESASVGGEVVQDEELEEELEFDIEAPSLPSWIGGSYSLVTSFLFGVVLLAVFPRFSDDLTDRVQDEPLRSAGVGALALIGVPVAAVILMLTIIGLPMGLIALFGFIVALWAGMIYAQYALGDWLLEQLDYESRFLALVAGMLVVTALGRVPVVAGIVQLAVILLGLGALGTGLYGAYRSAR